MKPLDRINPYPHHQRYCVYPQQTLAAAKENGLSEEQLTLSGVAILTFSKMILSRMQERCQLEEIQWISTMHHPYSAANVVMRGSYQGLDINIIVPAMGASPLGCIIEDLVACGVGAVFLTCAAWSLGSPVEFGDLIVPRFSIGPDGTSLHYGNTGGRVVAESTVVDALFAACQEQESKSHVGGNATCEAIYRITPRMVEDFGKKGCLCMDNGEASTLFTMAQTLGFVGGVLFQPYIDLHQGWNPSRLNEKYHATSRIQADVVLNASIRLKHQGLF